MQVASTEGRAEAHIGFRQQLVIVPGPLLSLLQRPASMKSLVWSCAGGSALPQVLKDVRAPRRNRCHRTVRPAESRRCELYDRSPSISYLQHQLELLPRMEHAPMSEAQNRLQELVAQVAASYFSNSHVGPNDIPTVINQIATSLGQVGASPTLVEADVQQTEPEVVRRLTSAQIRRSIRPDGLVSFEDGRAYKTLRRHLNVRGLTPEQYREKWGLPDNYPMVAPNYSKQRSELAKSLGLGQLGRRAEQPEPTATPEPTPAADGAAPRPRGR